MPLMMGMGDQIATRSAIEPFADAVDGGVEAVLRAERTLPGRRATSKLAERVGEADHELSKPAK